MSATPEDAHAAAPKKGKGKMVGIIVALVLVLVAGGAGAVLAPRLLAKNNAAEKPKTEDSAEAAEPEEKHEEPAEEEEEEEPKKPSAAGAIGEVAEISPIVVDTRAQDGSIRHVKVQFAIEIKHGVKPEDVKKLIPFAREAAIAYLRTQEFERLSDPKTFDIVRKELSTEVVRAVGKARAKRILIVDFVAQ
ncbi:MAG TPA: flagellar basal body-associated FliL family protein [Polyangiaceae bacterium]|nr:flagellar basal body-associated FliL family protein [Polyangiaceae bacterium]